MADEVFSRLIDGTATDQDTHNVLLELFRIYTPDPEAEGHDFLHYVTMQVALRYGRILDRARKAGNELHIQVAEAFTTSATNALESNDTTEMVMMLASYVAGLNIPRITEALKEVV